MPCTIPQTRFAFYPHRSNTAWKCFLSKEAFHNKIKNSTTTKITAKSNFTFTLLALTGSVITELKDIDRLDLIDNFFLLHRFNGILFPNVQRKMKFKDKTG